MFKNFTKSAFTLAEVLITLAIIGTIAAFTIPSLIQNVRVDDKANEASLKKNIRVINDATKQIVMIDAPNMNIKNLACTGDSHECLMNYYAKYINFAKTCKSSGADKCLGGAPKTSTYKCKTESGTETNCTLDISGFPMAVAADGTLMVFNFSSKGVCNTSTTARLEFKGESKNVTNACAIITIDVNGAKKPNGVSADRFTIPIGQFGLRTH